MAALFVAALFLALRLAPASMVSPLFVASDPAAAVAEIALRTICHAGPQDGDAESDRPDAPPGHAGCKLCPMCHLSAQPALLPAGDVAQGAPDFVPIESAVPLPPATGPPARPRVAAHPTGPPALSV